MFNGSRSELRVAQLHHERLCRSPHNRSWCKADSSKSTTADDRRAGLSGHGRGANGRLVRVEIHRGLPSQRHDKLSYAANRRQSAAWVREAPQIVGQDNVLERVLAPAAEVAR
jgi:hypothetical protein